MLIKTLRLARLSVRGVVHGVGFRPFVYGLATKHNLKGWVCNTSEDVKIEVEGEAEAIEQFYLELKTKTPPLAHIEDITINYHSPIDYKSFEIRSSIAEEGKCQLISPDIATCQACLSELLDSNDRRYRYPFTNCTNCGPRFTIIEEMPYDRPKTTMRYFQMCPQCQAEYDNSLDRRFHAQPNACPKCGPKIELVDNQEHSLITVSRSTECNEGAAKQSQLSAVSRTEIEIIKRQIERGLNSPLTSSMGRLFDALSALIGIRGEIDYEGQAAVELEMAAYRACPESFASCHSERALRSPCHSEWSEESHRSGQAPQPKNLAPDKLHKEFDEKDSYPCSITDDKGIRIIRVGSLLSAIIEDLRQGISQGEISLKFHNTVAQMTNQMCQLIANETNINQVALSGGVFQNRPLLRKTVSLLENSGFQVFTHRQVPCNDGGISLGQAVVANFAE